MQETIENAVTEAGYAGIAIGMSVPAGSSERRLWRFLAATTAGVVWLRRRGG